MNIQKVGRACDAVVYLRSIVCTHTINHTYMYITEGNFMNINKYKVINKYQNVIHVHVCHVIIRKQ